MIRRLVITACLLAIAPPLSRAAEASPASSPTAAEIVDRNVKARGGLEAWRAVTTLKMSGEMDVGGKGDARVPFVLWLKRPHKSRLEITFAGQNAIQAFDGSQGWKVRPFLNRDDVEPFTPAEARSAASWAELDGLLVDHARKGTKVELVGVDPVDGKKAYKLRLTEKDGSKRLLWVDATTFLEVKVGGEPRKLDGRSHAVEIHYRDWRTVDGLVIPFGLDTAVQGVKERQKMAISAVAMNLKVDDALFARPLLANARTAGGPGTP